MLNYGVYALYCKRLLGQRRRKWKTKEIGEAARENCGWSTKKVSIESL